MVPLRKNKENTQLSSSLVYTCGNEKPLQEEGESEGESDDQCEFGFLSSMTDQLLTEIFIRLPSDCACRYKTVCKNWYSLMSSRYFFSRYINHAPTTNTFTLVLQYHTIGPRTFEVSYPIGAISNHPLLSKSYKDHCLDLAGFVPKFKKCDPVFNPVHVVASCHDLLLCSKGYSTFYVVNLLTKQWIVLPQLPFRRKVHDYSLKAGLLCYHDQNDASWYEFKVIILPALHGSLVLDPDYPIPPELYAYQYTLRIFCSKSKQWTELVVDWYPSNLKTYVIFSPIISYNGMLHWLNGQSLVSLDHELKLNQHCANLPKILSFKHAFGFGVCQGYFRVARSLEYRAAAASPILLVWDLKDYQNGVWQLAFKVRLHKTSLPKYPIYFVAFHPYNRDIVFVNVLRTIYQLNMRTRNVEEYYKPLLNTNSHRIEILEATIPPILHQGFPTPVPSPVQE